VTAEVQTGERPRVVVERPKVPLVLKLFLLTTLLIVIVVALAVAFTIERANRVAGETADKSIRGAAELFRNLEADRLARLSVPIRLLGNDPSFVAYVGDSFASPTGVDLASINDQLEQRRQTFKSDVLILLDDEGRVITRTDRPSVVSPSGEDLYEQTPIVKKVVEEGLESHSGVVTFGNKLYHAAVAPVGAGARDVRIGFLLNAAAMDEAFAQRIAASTRADVMFVTANSISRSPGAPSFGMQQMSGVGQVLRSGKSLPPTSQTIGGLSYVITSEPLKTDNQTAGAAVFLRSLDRELAPFREIERALLIGGGVALFLALIFSWLIAKRMTRPIEQLAGMAQAVTAGDYSVQPNVARNDEVGILGRSFAKMISALRDKAELEELYAQMAAKSAERETQGRPLRAPMADEGTMLVTDLRGLSVGETDAATVIASVSRIMRLQEDEVLRQEGEVREMVGHRLISVFRGSRGIVHAIRAARTINEELASLNPPVGIGVGIATGDFVSGSVQLRDDSGMAIVGNAPLLALLFAWHAPTGSAYISYETAQAAGPEVMSSAVREEVRLKWLQQPLPVASLSLVSVSTGMMKSMATTSGATMTVRLGGAQGPAPTADLAPGQLFANRYKIEQVLGRGGMGVVYRAIDTQLDETVAIKTLPGDVMQRSPEDLERFKREIRLARKITHRNVLRTYDYGEADGVYFISMEFVRGYTLAELESEAPGRQMAPRVAMGIARQICRGLQAAHEQGIIHRDIKPQNVLIDSRGEVKLMDFGIARVAESREAMTQAGLIVGTPHYMSPEQVKGETLDPRSDVYAMGVLIYEMVSGRRPFESSSLTGVLTAHITETAKPLLELRREAGQQVNDIVMRCLAKEPKQRYANAGELLGDLDQVQVPAAAAAA
jgi:eukaryotic-like serine/threonine-protein kinase